MRSILRPLALLLVWPALACTSTTNAGSSSTSSTGGSSSGGMVASSSSSAAGVSSSRAASSVMGSSVMTGSSSVGVSSSAVGSSASVSPSGSSSASTGSSSSASAGSSSASNVSAGSSSSSSGAGMFTHEPAGFLLLGEWRDESALVANGWADDGNPSAWGAKTRVTSGYAGAPRVGGPAVIQTFYAGGVEGGHDAGRMQFSLPAGTRELFFAAELQFRADYPVSTSSGGNKQLFVTFAGGGRYFVNLDNGLAAGRWGIYQQSSPLQDSTINVVYGSWVTVEWYLRGDTGAGDGVMTLWIDGVQALHLTGLTFPAGDMVLAYDDGSNNGNHYPLASDPRKIGTDLGGPVDAYRWASVLRVSAPQ